MTNQEAVQSAQEVDLINKKPSIRWREPVLAWLIGRLICMIALVAGSNLFPIGKYYDLRKDNRHAGAQRDLRQYFHYYAKEFRDPEQFGKQPMLFVTSGGREAWAKPFVHWDVLWWLSVAEVGYVADPKLETEQNVVFYPLFPLLVRGLSLLGLHPIVSALLVANGAMLLVICLLYRLVLRRSGVAAARWTLALWLSFPSSFFGVVPYSEPLMALFSMLVMQTFLDGKYVSAGLWCGLASALKNQGVILAGAMVIPLLRGPHRVRALIGLACSGFGLLAYMAFLQQQYGDPFLFVAIQKQWRPQLGNNNPLSWLLVMLLGSAHSIYLILNEKSLSIRLNSSRLLDPWLGWWILFWLPAVRKLHWGLLLSSAVMLALPLSTGTVASLGRYVWVILPVFVVMGESLYKSGWRWPILITSTLGMLWQAFLFGGGWEVI
jgi:hypothetical protein